MASAAESFKINLNQNLWGLVVAYAALGAAEHWGLKRLGYLSFIMTIGMTLSVLATTLFYTVNYCRSKSTS